MGSTRAKLVTFTGTNSGNAKIADVSLQILGAEDMKAIVVDMLDRIQVKPVLRHQPVPPAPAPLACYVIERAHSFCWSGKCS